MLYCVMRLIWPSSRKCRHWYVRLQCAFLKCRAEPYVLHGKGLSVQICEMLRVRLKIELELVGVEALFFIAAKFFILRVHAIFAIVQQGMADRGKMGADLMRPSGQQIYLGER